MQTVEDHFHRSINRDRCQLSIHGLVTTRKKLVYQKRWVSLYKARHTWQVIQMLGSNVEGSKVYFRLKSNAISLCGCLKTRFVKWWEWRHYFRILVYLDNDRPRLHSTPASTNYEIAYCVSHGHQNVDIHFSKEEVVDPGLNGQTWYFRLSKTS